MAARAVCRIFGSMLIIESPWSRFETQRRRQTIRTPVLPTVPAEIGTPMLAMTRTVLRTFLGASEIRGKRLNPDMPAIDGRHNHGDGNLT